MEAPSAGLQQEPSTVVRLRGLPYSATEADVSLFLDGFGPLEILLLSRAGEAACVNAPCMHELWTSAHGPRKLVHHGWLIGTAEGPGIARSTWCCTC